jgi:Tol biopolymer transport system component
MRTAASFLIVAAVCSAGVAAAAKVPAPTLFEPGVISAPGNDEAPTFSPDSRTIFFSRSSGKRSFLVTSRQAGGRWSKPEIASFAGPYSDQQPAFSPDGHCLCFTAAFAPASSSLRIEMIFSSENPDLFIRVLQGTALLPSGPDRQGITHGLKSMASCNNRRFARET